MRGIRPRRPAAVSQALTAEPMLIAGMGASFGVSVEEARALLDIALDQLGLDSAAVTAIATVDSKAREQGLVELAARLGVPLVLHSAAELARVAVPHPSPVVDAVLGTPSVAEAAALLGLPGWQAGNPAAAVELLVGKTASPRATVAIARHWLADLHHHGDAELSGGLLDFAVNVSSEPMPDWLSEPIAAACRQLDRYPDPRAATAAVAAWHRRPVAEVLLTAGASEAFTLLAQGFSPGRAVIVHPQFTEPEVALRAAGWRIDRVLLDPADWFALDPDRIPDEAGLVVIGNPTNPTGTLHPMRALLALRRPGRLVVVDEAFLDSIPGEPESLAEQEDLSGIVVVRSLTKTWALAGLRVGYLLGDAGAVATAAAVQPHWAVSSPALAAAQACLSEVALPEAHRRAAAVTAHRRALTGELARRGFELHPDGAGPFVLTRHPAWPGLHAELRSLGIAVRRADTFPGLGPGWIRIAVRDEAATEPLLAALDVLSRVRRAGP
ncbi:MAG TPA: Rv2231c family pyridoxal phosphate-dependent protein CobC [Jatrophihabitans sp.]|uniref:Rv2231c family pyridoxal phosphate-dependent protein CobC n=1 Tax=Jatrophihabitans sp. TaxID=1932789 RepID=UPI002EEABA90